MGLKYHAALENSLIISFMDSRHAPLPVFCGLVDASKMKSTICKNRLVATNRTALVLCIDLSKCFDIWL